MNIVIIGGLLIVGLAAIVGVVLLVLGEQRSERTRVVPAPVTTSLPATNTTAAPASAPPVEERWPQSQPGRTSIPYTPTRPLTSVPTAPTAHETTSRLRNEEVSRSALNGQFNELAAELRTLSQEAAELERRLHNLTEMVAHLQDSSSGSFGAEEEATSHPAFDNAPM